MVTHLSKIKSDHRPLSLFFNPKLKLPRGRPFRFLAGWVEHPDFEYFVSANWNFRGNMADALAEFTSYLKVWNKSVYGHIISRKKILISKLADIHWRMNFSGSNHLTQIKMEVRLELENVLHHEELLWKVKANVLFRNLYGEDPGPMGKLPASRCPRLDSVDKYWDTVGGAVYFWVKAVFNGRNITSDLNNTLVVLIPKVSNSFRSISLCFVLYKLIMKVIANRFKSVFLKITAHEQAGFIVGWNITDNIITAQ
ncbi:reverse transcriptase [Gossypium australe]|uniref:Reverse transcriptase n=1 Tax=Gossypium australe TaxID=47621 RepID=A0A5B6VTJ3_9ROSI|nr:reverse transcriptase [Gossypium australe]